MATDSKPRNAANPGERSSALRDSREGFRLYHYLIFVAVTLLTVLLCVCVGSVNVPLGDTLRIIWASVTRQPVPAGMSQSIILFVRLPRVLCVALVGASLSLCGGVMQGLLRNPLADASTLGVSSGASLGAMVAIVFGITIPALPFTGTMTMAMLFALLSMLAILSLAHKLDRSLSTGTIILIGVIFSMFASSVMSLLIAFSGENLRPIMFWTMGSLAGSNYVNVLTLLAALVVCGAVILRHARELNAFAVGEDNARHVGVPVKRIKLTLMIAVSALVGVCVSVGGTIGFVGLVMPHITRMVSGPNHGRLLPGSLFSGAVFLMLSDLTARTILSPLELPIGVVTSFIGSIVFIYIFYSSRKAA